MRDDGGVTTNSASGNFTGPVIQVGTVHGGVHINDADPVRSYYLTHVDRIAPRHLADRNAELAELADFCTAPEGESRYVWWQADAWSGKSALLSTFTLNPPPGVRLVSFFITGSEPYQADRRAFVDNILEQLCALLGIPLPRLTESTRESHMLGLLGEAARRYRDSDERFALVVDGLDEDRGLDGTPDAHSVAALLPVTPPAGMRVIVSGRPNPPIPRDVPDHHPLREPEVIRVLAPSPEAAAVRDAMERDLKRLFAGSPAEQDLLGLVVAAGAGLTTPDLAELIGISEWQIEDQLCTAAGRSFTRRPSERPDQSPDVHLLAHGELVVTARSMLGSRLAHYQERLHAWADGYAIRHWPRDTPSYLLRGYFAMLRAAQDLGRMMACATDPYRHRLALTRTGGDGDSLAEIIATQNTITASTSPDLVALVRLAVHRVHLHRSNSRVPSSLPSGWASLGQVDRAESMIESFREPVDRIDALLSTAALCRLKGETLRAEKLLDQAGEEAATITSSMAHDQSGR